MSKISRRQFMASGAMAALPLAQPLSQFLEADEPSVNCSPSRQVIPIKVAAVLSRVTGFDFGLRVVSEAEGRRFAHILRREFGRIQTEVRSVTASPTFDSNQLCFLEAFTRAGAFRIQRTNNFITLSVEL